MIGVILVGLVAGWLAGKLMRGRGYGIIADILLGLVGAIIGEWLFARLGVPVYGGFSFLAMATVGAVILVGAAHLVRSLGEV
ncbi:MAG TPA: GlsB/YeaQ/YmgE family stress response membrane protein [Candidatus Binataceae bacterium]|nr:GlsB/YeaQ/YmgE family stress response membrane protein [Candidatus Binataceae bacterium]